MFQFLVDHTPALLTHQLQTLQQCFAGVQGTTGLGLELTVGQVFVQGHVVQRHQQNAPHRSAVGGQAAANRQINRNQPLRSSRTGDVEDVIAFERRHVARLVQLLAHAVQIRLSRHGQRRGRQIGMAQRQHFGQQGVGTPVSGRIAQLDQGVQTTAHRRPGNFRAVADLRDGQMPLAFLKRLHHRQATGQRRHEVRITGKRLNTLGRRRHNRWRDTGNGIVQSIIHSQPPASAIYSYGMPGDYRTASR